MLIFKISNSNGSGNKMFKKFRDKMALSGVTVLSLGIALLIFTFISAYGFLTQSLSIITSTDLAQTFGNALAPLIATCIRLMYLGIMGWVSSLITIRGVTIITHTPQLQTPTVQKEQTAEQKPQPEPESQVSETEKPKEKETKENEQKEPEIAIIPPEVAPETPVPNA